ncbi:small ribosomal subunit protein bS16m [Tribolium castaneum]|uniref:Small ribosomal subunit protein bS16m n=1 Tax=Tribolium castaneum TaxID=7070 RepID=D6WQ75_TRICA|nr:PREDICTED: probable 28S ribosomal protein S16, mitochondrial [Tribolium castaneum]EFA06934.1 putative 28S ribosomal protein S16, mitochondrial-like Protein [Tribolium castaneum]|eukprot:XP_971865.1 PREDICTED: probable 28S ribosomal protein S16, mitochondrial [Tribolium castaneum]
MLPPSSGIGQFAATSAKVIRFVRAGCTNRPFYHIVVAERRREQFEPVIEQVGSYDPMPNANNEKLVSLNLERISYWIGNGAGCSGPVEELLGLAGYFPIHPRSYMTAWRNRRKADEEAAAKEKADDSNEEKSETSSSV